jgi:hypothetical protein
VSQSTADLGKAVEDLEGLGLPIGWNPDKLPSSPYEWALRLLGILLTSLAVSLGAPFWFDLLNRFIVVRSTVKPTEKSPPDKSKQ